MSFKMEPWFKRAAFSTDKACLEEFLSMDCLLRDCLGVSLPADWNSDQTWGTENNRIIPLWGGNQSLMGMCKGKIYFRDFLHIKHIHLPFFCVAWDDCLISNLLTSGDTELADLKGKMNMQKFRCKMHHFLFFFTESFHCKGF